MATNVGSAVGYLDLDISGFLASLRSAQSEADKASKNIVTKFGANMQNAGKKLTSAGLTLSKSVTVPIVGLGTAVIKTSSDFESAMSKVSAISGATGGDLDALNKKAQEMGAKTKFSATEAANAFEYMAMAGWKTEDMLDGIEGIMNLAAASGEDLATTSDIVTDALTAFGLSAKDSGHFADILAKASSSANTNVSMLGESFKYVAPVTGALGYSAEDTAIALGLMANAGIKSSQAGTALRSSISRLVKPTDDAAAMMDKYGISLTNADGTMKPLGEVMNNLRKKLGGLSEAEQAQAAATLFGQEAMSGMLAIINASDSDYQKLTDSIYNADGAAQQMANTMLNNLSGQLTLLKSALEGLAIQFGEILMPYIKQFVGWLQSLVQKLQEMTSEQKEQIVKWAAIAAAIGPVLIVFGKLTSSVGSIITTFGKIPGAIKAVTGGFMKLTIAGKNVFEGFNLAKAGFTALGAQASHLGAALAGVTAPMIAIVAAVALVIAAFVSLWKNNEEFRNKIIAIWDGIKSKFESFARGIVDRLNDLGFDFKNFGEVVKAIWNGFCSVLAPIFEATFEIISSILGTVLDVLTGILDIFIGIFTGNWKQCWKGIKEIFVGIWNGIVTLFSNVISSIKRTVSNFITTIINFFAQLPTNIAKFITNAYNSVVTWANNMIAKAREMGRNFLNTVVSFIQQLPGKIKHHLNSTINNLKIWVTQMGQKGKEAVQSLINNIKSTASGIADKVKSIGSNIVSGVWNGIKNSSNIFMENIKGFFSGIVDKVKTTLGIHSPSKVFAEKIGKWLPAGIAKGFISAIPSTMKVIQKDLNKGINNIETDDISADADTMVSGFINKLKSIYNEIALWFESIESRIGNSVDSMMQSLDMLIRAGQVIINSDGTLGYIGHNGFTKSGSSEDYIDRTNPKDKNSNGNGDIFIFNSPKAIDEIEAAKQMKKTKQDMAEGF